MHVPKHHYLLLKLLQELPNSSSSFLLVHLVMYQPSEMVKLKLTREIIQIFISFFFFRPDRNLLTYTALPAKGNREKVEMLIKGSSTPFLPGRASM